MLIDDVKIKVIAGNGGEGAQTYLGFRKGVKVGANGGDGGRGGSIYFLASNNIFDLSQFQFKKEIKALHGTRGISGNHNGKDAEDITILVPLGTKVIDETTTKEIEINNAKNPILIAKGGEKGMGSYSLSRLLKNAVQANWQGEDKKLHLILSLIADIGLIGLPNAGKSSLLEALTNANPKIGDYPFTTLEPNLGTIGKIIIADIPGLIEGASEGVGLGTKFLKHIEKTKILVHCISAVDDQPLVSYKTVRKEFEKHNPTLLEKEEIILVTKKDLVDGTKLREKVNLLKRENSSVLISSVFDPESLGVVKNTLLAMVSEN